jgi:GDPmannose 4,6-dehydratase
MKTALVTGITGQDGSYLAEHLLSLGYRVYGLVRRSSLANYGRLDHIRKDVVLIEADLLDQLSLIRALELAKPDEVYNLAAQSFVPTSWEQPVLTGEITGLGVTKILEAIRQVNPQIRFYQASSSEMFGKVLESPQNEHTPFYPRSPYGAAKCYAHYITVNYRESYGMFCVSGILFNHESPRRGKEFVTRKISDGVARIWRKEETHLLLGNLDARRDWGYAGDYVKAMHLMLQNAAPVDFVIATGESHSVRDFVCTAFSYLGMDWQMHVLQQQNLFRPAEVHTLVGDAHRAHQILQWKPEVSFDELVIMMVESDLRNR